ncbi:MAG: 16S rRNA (guanine(966)-N(2))-methyltransferase RsmD [Nitrospirae bacterium]|nr:16S rRNA (guanine(966)-N(2))-methyltransferase RsmD [Nitrospirota bacterium]
MIKIEMGKIFKTYKPLRPTTSKVREALFNILRDRIEGAIFFDLYAGTGAIGIEALRHGANAVVFVEASKNYTENIKQKIKSLGFEKKSKIISKKVLSFLRSIESEERQFDIIFLDPPYHTDEINYALSMIGKLHLLKDDGLVIAEHFTKRQLPHEFGRLRFIKDYKYGDTVLSLFMEETPLEIPAGHYF